MIWGYQHDETDTSAGWHFLQGPNRPETTALCGIAELGEMCGFMRLCFLLMFYKFDTFNLIVFLGNEKGSRV